MAYSEPRVTKFTRFERMKWPVNGMSMLPTSLDYTTIELVRPGYNEIKHIEEEIYQEHRHLKIDGFKPEFIVMSKWLYEKFAAFYGSGFKTICGLRVLPVDSDDLYFDIVPDDPLNYFIHTWGKNA